MQSNFSLITPCGEFCDECQKLKNKMCQGCLISDGHCQEWAGSGRCPVYACARDHGALFCGVCAEFPCEDLPEKIHWNADIVARLAELAKAYREEKERS